MADNPLDQITPQFLGSAGKVPLGTGTPSSLGDVLGQIAQYGAAAIPGPGQILGAAGLIDSLPGSPTNLDPNGIAKQGMIPTPENLDRFDAMKGAIKNVLMKSSPSMTSEAAEALAFHAARYPNRTNLASSIRVNPDLPIDTGGLTSVLDPPQSGLDKTIDNIKAFFGHTSRPSITPRMDIQINPNQNSISDIVDTLGHETQHAVDVSRKGSPFVKDTINRNINNMMDTLGMDNYANLPSERPAYQAGSTAARAYQNYLKLNPASGVTEQPALDRWGQPRIQLVDEHGVPVMLK